RHRSRRVSDERPDCARHRPRRSIPAGSADGSGVHRGSVRRYERRRSREGIHYLPRRRRSRCGDQIEGNDAVVEKALTFTRPLILSNLAVWLDTAMSAALQSPPEAPRTLPGKVSMEDRMKAKSWAGYFSLAVLALLLAGCAATSSPPAAAGGDPTKAQITVLYDAFGKSSDMQKDWRYAALIESGGKRILVDTGNNG